jgi:glycosyltransferase involved in cell wall biosynthesis
MQRETHDRLLTVVIPVYNEAENLPVFAPAAVEFCRARAWQVIFVNDGSRDESKDILAGFA